MSSIGKVAWRPTGSEENACCCTDPLASCYEPTLRCEGKSASKSMAGWASFGPVTPDTKLWKTQRISGSDSHSNSFGCSASGSPNGPPITICHDGWAGSGSDDIPYTRSFADYPSCGGFGGHPPTPLKWSYTGTVAFCPDCHTTPNNGSSCLTALLKQAYNNPNVSAFEVNHQQYWITPSSSTYASYDFETASGNSHFSWELLDEYTEEMLEDEVQDLYDSAESGESNCLALREWSTDRRSLALASFKFRVEHLANDLGYLKVWLRRTQQTPGEPGSATSTPLAPYIWTGSEAEGTLVVGGWTEIAVPSDEKNIIVEIVKSSCIEGDEPPDP